MTATMLRAAALAALLALCVGAGAQGGHPGIAARVNGAEISYQRFNQAYQEYLREKGVNIVTTRSPAKLDQLRRETMELMIEQELVYQAAQKRGIEVTTAEIDAALAEISDAFETSEAFVRRLETEGYSEETYHAHLQRMIAAKKHLDGIRASASTVSDDELETYYRDNELRLTLPEQVRVRHILLTWKPLGTPDDRAALRKQMVPILEQARSGSDFAELAKSHSEDATARDGGDTGFFHRSQMVPAFEEAAFALQPGEISDIVETPFGLHIIRLEEYRAPRLLPLDEIREPLRDHVREEKMDAAVTREKTRLREAADIEMLIPL